MLIRSRKARGWSESCECLANARLSDLSDGAKISEKHFELIGYAVGNLDGIKTASTTGKTRVTTNLFSNFRCSPGAFGSTSRRSETRLISSAIDRQGVAQNRDPEGTFPDGATGQQVIKVQVV